MSGKQNVYGKFRIFFFFFFFLWKENVRLLPDIILFPATVRVVRQVPTILSVMMKKKLPWLYKLLSWPHGMKLDQDSAAVVI